MVVMMMMIGREEMMARCLVVLSSTSATTSSSIVGHWRRVVWPLLDDHHAALLLRLLHVQQLGKEGALHRKGLADDQLGNEPLLQLQLAEYEVLLAEVTAAEVDADAEQQKEHQKVGGGQLQRGKLWK